MVAAEVLRLQRYVGNRAVSAAVRAGTISPARRALTRLVVSPQVKSPFEDPAAPRDARSAAAALDAYLVLSRAVRRACVEAAYKRNLPRVLAALSRTDQMRTYRDALIEIGFWVQEEETRAAAGMTDAQIAAEQMNFLKRQAETAAARKAPRGGPTSKPTAAEVEAVRREQLESASTEPPAPSVWDAMSPAEQVVWTEYRKSRSKRRRRWDAMSPAEQAAWIERGNKAIKKVVDHANAKHPELALEATHFRLAFADVELLETLAFSEPDDADGSRAAVGRDFVEAVELDAAYGMSVAVHEIAGHPEFEPFSTSGVRASGTYYHLDLYDAAMAKLPGYVKPEILTDARQAEVDAYGYPEAELYANLRSVPYHTVPTSADIGNLSPDAKFGGVVSPGTFVAVWVGVMKRRWSPKLIVALLRGYRMRVAIDPRITPAALEAFDRAVLLNFDAATQAKIKH